MKMKRKMVLATAGVLAAGMLAGCGKAESDAGQAGSEAMEIQILSTSPTSDYLGTEVVKQLEAKYNIKLKIVDVGESYLDTYQTMIVSGETPDYFLWIPRTSFDQFQSQGVFAEIPDGLVEEKCPELYAFFQKFVDEENPFKYTSVDGKNYGLPVPWSIGAQSQVTAIRKDWMEKVGIEKEPETLEELHDVLLAFRNQDPDGNGKQDTYGWAAGLDGAGSPTMFTPVFGAYGVYPGIFYEKDGQVLRGEVQPEAKEALETLHQWYEEGIIDPEFVVETDDTLKEKWIAEKFGYVTGRWWQMIPETAFNDGFYHDKLMEKNPDAELVILEAPKGENGESGMVQTNPMRGDMVNFSARMADEPEKMAKYIEVFGNSAFQEEVLKLCWRGTEGVTYERTEDGGYQWTAEYEDPVKREEYGIGFTALGSNFQDYDLLAQFMTEPQYMDLRMEASTKGKGKFDMFAAIKLQSWSDNAEALNRLALQTYVDFITGVKSLDEFDAFVEEWYALGGKQVMEEAQQVYESLQ